MSSDPTLADLDVTAQAALVRRGDVSAVELVEAAIARIDALNPVLNAVVTPLYEQALDAARHAPAGPLAGVPYLVKDLVAEVAGAPIAEGSRFVAGFVSERDSELVSRLRRAGAVVVGKASTSEFGLVPTCEPALCGATRNPWDPSRSTSGSSGGSAAAVASGMVAAAHANDLAGSIRYPASACGLFGLKPTRGRNPLGPRYGDVISGWLVEHAITRTVRDSALILDATAGPAPGDPYPAPPVAGPFAAHVGAEPGRLRIGFTSRLPDGSTGHPDCIAALDDAVALCAALGHEMVEADLPGLTPERGDAIGTGFRAAAAWLVRRWVGRLGREPAAGELDPLTAAYLERGDAVGAGQYLLALTELQVFACDVASFLGGFDAWLTPTMSTPPPLLGSIVSTPDRPLRASENGGPTVAYPAVVANITGNPAMSVPLYRNAAGLPIGVHFLGRYGDEATLFRLAAQLEAARPWAHLTPVVHARSAMEPA